MPLLKRARLTQGAFRRHFSSKKELLREAIDERVDSRAVHARQGGNIVLGGTLVGLVLSAIVAVLTFLTHRRLPYRKMLV
jgi:high-affinity iron transporter